MFILYNILFIYNGMKNSKKNKNNLRKTNNTRKKNNRKKKLIIITGGANFLDYFTPSYWFPSKPTDPTQVGKLKGEFIEKDKADDLPEAEAVRVAEPIAVANEVQAETKKKKKKKKGKDIRELYQIKYDELRADKEFFDNPNIMTWCFNEPDLEPVGIVHVTSLVGINIVRTSLTTLTNIVGSKGTLDENMHRLRNEIYIEIEHVMKRHEIDKVCNVGVAFTKDSGTLILNAFGTALRKKI